MIIEMISKYDYRYSETKEYDSLMINYKPMSAKSYFHVSEMILRSKVHFLKST